MHHRSLIVFDIETIPDTDAVPALTGVDDPDVGARRDALTAYHLEITEGRNPFPRQPFHRVVAISFLRAEIERDAAGERYHLQELRSGGDPTAGEAELVAGFFRFLERSRPRLVTFNGRGFDLPVLRFRAMKHGVAAPGFHLAGDRRNAYTHRYADDWHCDLMDVLSDRGAAARVRLSEVCAVLGLPGKLGMDGSAVAGRFDAGEIAAIRDYCETDVLNTYLVYLRHMRHLGTLSAEAFEKAVGDLLSYLRAEAPARPHLGEYLEAWAALSGGAATRHDATR